MNTFFHGRFRNALPPVGLYWQARRIVLPGIPDYHKPADLDVSIFPVWGNYSVFGWSVGWFGPKDAENLLPSQ